LLNPALTPHGVDGHDRPFDCQHIQQFRDGDDLAGLLSHLDLGQHKALACGKGRDHMNGGPPFRPVMRAADRLTTNDDHALWYTAHSRDPGGEAAVELRVARRSPRWSRARCAVLEGAETAQKLQPLGAKQGNRGEAHGAR